MDNSTTQAPRLKAEIDQEYTRCAVTIGAHWHEIEMRQAQIEKIVSRMNELSQEVLALQESEKAKQSQSSSEENIK